MSDSNSNTELLERGDSKETSASSLSSELSKPSLSSGVGAEVSSPEGEEKSNGAKKSKSFSKLSKPTKERVKLQETSELQTRELESLLKSSWTPMVERMRGIWSWFARKFFDELEFPEARIAQIQQASEEGTIVYLLRSRSYLTYMIYNVLFIVYKLPLVRFAPDLYWVPWQVWAQKLRVLRGWVGRLFGRGGAPPKQLFTDLVRRRVPTMLFLDKPVTLWTYVRRLVYLLRNLVRTMFRRPEAPGGKPLDLLEELIGQQRKQDLPIFVCPQIMVWDRAPTSARKSFWDVMFGEKESPGLTRELYQFLRNKKQSLVHGGEPINLKLFVSRYTEQLSDAELAIKLRAWLKDRFDKEFRVATGPVQRPAEEMKERVLRAPRVRKVIRKRAEEEGVDEEVMQAKAKKILERMAATFNMPTARKLDWFLGKIWNRMYTRHESDPRGLAGIDVDQDEVERLREAAMEHPVVLLPCHKSHVDYLIMSQILMHYDMVPPHIAAGDNLLIPVVGWLFRRSGAFFLRRSFGKDELYRTIFNEYVLRLLREGCTLEFFIEGGRSRTGKLREPKMGMLSMLVDAALEKRIRDFHLAPISIGYDRVVEGESYSRELLGGKKKRESLAGLLRSARNFLSINFGRIVVRLAEPISIREAIDKQVEEERKENPDFDPIQNNEHRRQLIQTLAYRVMYDINRVSWVMPSSLVVAVLMTEQRRGISHGRMVEEVSWLRQEVEARGAKVYHFNEPDQMVRRTTKSLSRLIKAREFLDKNLVVYRPRASRRLELAYYRNQMIHLFVSEGVIACALQAFNWQRESDGGIAKTELLKEVRFLSLLLKKEFTYKPSPDIQDNLDETLQLMEERKILSVCSKTQIVEAGEGKRMIAFLRHLFWPFIDSYWVASIVLFALQRDGSIEEKAFIRRMQEVAESLYHEGHLRYSDAVSMETLKNAISLYEEMGVIVRVPVEEGGRASRKRQIELTEAYLEPKTILDFACRIGTFSSCYHAKRVVEWMKDKLTEVKEEK